MYTKIVATLGPATNDYQTIKAVIEAGARALRLNFSHGTRDEQQQRLDMVRKAAGELQIQVTVFQDLQGPKIRIGQLSQPSFMLEKGNTITVTTEPFLGTDQRISIDYPYLHEEISCGSRILIDDGLLELSVQQVSGKDIICKIIEGGELKPRKGVNPVGVPLSHLSSFTEKDIRDLDFAFDNDLDYVALSFVRKADDVKALKAYMLSKYGKVIPIIAKIEKPEAVKDIHEIIKEAGAIMVARGDLGVEMQLEEVPIAQKEIIHACLEGGLPVITATQMLDSMIENPRPTRAEAADVANAVLDGTSAVMLSGETAAGAFPIRAVQIMHRITCRTEQSDEFYRAVIGQNANREYIDLRLKRTTTEAVGLATRELAMALHASYIACFTQSGSTARRIIKFRPGIPIIAFTPVVQTARKLALAWGVTPVLIADDLKTVDDLLAFAPAYLKEHAMVTAGQKVVVTAGVPVGYPGMTNMIKVVEI